MTIERWAVMFFNDSITPDARFILKVFIIAVILLGGACLSADIADKRRRDILSHFLLGLLVPYVYALLIFCFLKRAEEKLEISKEPVVLPPDFEDPLMKRLRDIQTTQRQKRPGLVRESETATVAEDQFAVPAPSGNLTREFFESIAVDSTGERKGPFRITLIDENADPLTAERITAVVGDVIAFELIDQRNGNLKKLRLPISQIKDCEKI